MADIMAVWSWSLSDFDRLESIEDLQDWHSRAVGLYNKMHTKGDGS